VVVPDQSFPLHNRPASFTVHPFPPWLPSQSAQIHQVPHRWTAMGTVPGLLDLREVRHYFLHLVRERKGRTWCRGGNNMRPCVFFRPKKTAGMVPHGGGRKRDNATQNIANEGPKLELFAVVDRQRLTSPLQEDTDHATPFSPPPGRQLRPPSPFPPPLFCAFTTGVLPTLPSLPVTASRPFRS